MSSLYQSIRNRANRLGNEGLIGVGVLALCLIYYLFALTPTLEHIEQMQQHIDELKESIQNSASNTAALRNKSPAEQLSAYYKFFPSEKSSPQWLEKIYQAAQDESVQLDEGDYRPSNKKGEEVVHYQINLPVRGSYLQLRKFLAKVLSEIPNISLDQISYERSKIGDSAVDANIRLTLYLRASL